MELLKKLEIIYNKLKNEAIQQGNKKPGKYACYKVKKLKIWRKVEPLVRYTKYGAFLQLFNGYICSECNEHWTVLSQQKICEKCYSSDVQKYRKERYSRACTQRINGFIEKIGRKCPKTSKQTVEKRKKTCQIRYGGNAPTCNSEVLEKRRQNELKRSGYTHSTQRPEVRQKLSNAIKEAYAEETIKKRQETNLERYGHINGRWSEIGKKKADKTWQSRTVEDNKKSQELRAISMKNNPKYHGYDHAMRDPAYKEDRRKRLGYVSPFEREDVQKKSKETWLANGYKNPSSSELIKQKKLETYLKYGVISPSQLPGHKEKIRNTNLEKSGGKYTHHLQDPLILGKALKSAFKVHKVVIEKKEFEVQGKAEEFVLKWLVKKYGIKKVITQFDKRFTIDAQWTPDFYIKDKGYIECKSTYTLYELPGALEKNKEKAASIKNLRWAVVIKGKVVILPKLWYKEINTPFTVTKAYCEQYPGEYQKTFVKTISAYVKKIKDNIVLRDNTLYCKSNKCAIELGFLFEDSTATQDKKELRYRFKNRQVLAEKKGWRLVKLWHHQWMNNRDACLSYLRNLLCNTSERVGARKCDFIKKSVKDKQIQEFLQKNHIQGAPKSGIAYCLTYENELVAVCCFSKIVSERGSTVNKGFELIRFATARSVQGAASKLLDKFKKDYPNTRIISYSDNMMFNGGLYKTLGFTKIHETPPDYKVWWSGFDVRPKQSTKLSNLIKIEGFNSELSEWKNCIRLNLHRIYDAGKIKWELRT